MRQWSKVLGLSVAVVGWTPPSVSAQTRLLDRPARLEVRDVPLERALVMLQRASGVELAYSPDLLPEDRRVSCDCRNATVAGALDRLLADTGLEYRGLDGKVVIGRWRTGSRTKAEACDPRSGSWFVSACGWRGGEASW
jgi:hypothetical protein